MHTTTLRKIGDSVMLTVPPDFLDLLQLRAGATVRIGMEGNRLVIESSPQPRYRLDDLLDLCEVKGEINAADRQWLGAKPVGDELL